MSKIVLQDAFKRFTRDQDKVLAPEETVARFRRRLGELDMDILRQTLRIDNGRLDIPVFVSECGAEARALTGNKRQMGKGGTPEQAEASAVMELAERYSFFSFYQNPANFSTHPYAQIRDKAIPFDLLAQSVHDQSQDPQACQGFFETLPLRWTAGYNLTMDQEVLIPFDWFYAINEYNGPAAGNCTEEALSQGICEITERHVCALISKNRLAVPGIAPESATDPLVQEMLAKYERAGIRLWISDFSLDTGIPTVGILAYDPSTFPEKSEIVWTAGTTPDPEKALSRALTEVAQLAGDFKAKGAYMASGLPKLTDLDGADFITQAEATVPIQKLPDISASNIKTEVESLIQAWKTRGHSVLAVDTTHPRLGVPAYYLIVPGAHFRERAAAGMGMFLAKLIAQTFPPDGAGIWLARLETVLPQRYYIKFYQGTARLSQGDPEGALDLYQQALRLDPPAADRAGICSYAGIALREMARYPEAIDILEKGAEADPERPDIFNTMGVCYFKLKAHQKAIACFEKVLALDPGSAMDYANIGTNYRELGQVDQAIHYYQTALSLDPSIDFARDNLFKLLDQTGE